jgi:tetrahydromethanopterin S-methyltransferase subunit C
MLSPLYQDLHEERRFSSSFRRIAAVKGVQHVVSLGVGHGMRSVGMMQFYSIHLEAVQLVLGLHHAMLDQVLWVTGGPEHHTKS